ncbi:hypothetical protein RDV84_16215 [Lysobacter yananisis]|uniref:Delta-60 repeat domain-containing protein n=1 Tax=Lysobacter yananisis TaxID=1003114 RepID=A0ABY9P3J2_9GAMM|nr:hypothetical protein [Lysobacter yananisis]WMT01521.1 hypothetical protein RDV84_16215 [Lysobacter yananisis]
MNRSVLQRGLPLALAIGATLAAASAQAKLPDGALDPAFGRRGLVVTDFPVNDDFVRAVAIQADGKILTIGEGGGDAPLHRDYLHCRLLRFGADGKLDAGFGDGGQVRIKLRSNSQPAACRALAVQADGRILVAGGNKGDALLLRFLADGKPDRGFSRDGVQTLDAGGFDEFYGLALQADGRIVAAGKRFDADSGQDAVVLARYRGDGNADRGFGRNGVVVTAHPEQAQGAGAQHVLLQADGKIVVAGGGGRWNLIARYLRDGRPDPGFGKNGSTVDRITGLNAGAQGLVLQTDGKFLSSHPIVAGSGVRGTLLRHNADGSLDTTYHRPDLEISGRLAPQSDGRVLVVGNTAGAAPKPGRLQRVNPDGSVDATFAVAPIDFGGNDDYFIDLAVPGGGRMVVAAWLSDENRIGLARVAATTYCLADPVNPGRWIGFSESGWFSTIDSGIGGSGQGLLAQGRLRSVQPPGQPAGRALSAGGPAPAAYRVDAFAVTGDVRGFGFANVSKRGSAPATYGLVDTRMNDPACKILPGR